MWWASQFNPQSPANRPHFGTSYNSQYQLPPQQTPPLEWPLSECPHPAMQTILSQFPTQKTRKRTSFDPELELPKLQRWFTENQHPSRQQIQQYVKELNGLESRRGRQLLDINNVVDWFKNARTAQKRAEINGFSAHSPTNGGSENITPNLQLILSEICRPSPSSTSIPDISEETRRKFDVWWASQFNPQSPANRPHFGTSYNSQYQLPPQQTPPLERPLSECPHPAMQTVLSQFPTRKTRKRTSFDPEHELPKLQRWFTENQYPSIHQIQQYVTELNGLESRRSKNPLNMHNVVYWFKNARAAQKKAEINGFSAHSPTNGEFLLSEDSISAERLKSLQPRAPHNSNTFYEFSNAGSDMDDDDMGETHPPSPSVPLLLTTSRKMEFREPSPKPQKSPAPSSDIQVENCKGDPKDEPLNYASTDHANNNKSGLSDPEDDSPETENDTKSHFESSSTTSHAGIRSLSRYSPEIDAQMFPRNHHELERLPPGFPLVPNTMSGLSHTAASTCSGPLNMTSLTVNEQRNRNRKFIDPVTEVPRLEQWFALNTHPSRYRIIKYTKELNCMVYRQKFLRLEPKNVQFWFKNRRAKSKRL